MGEPLFIPSLFSKVFGCILLIAIAGIVGVILIFGSITGLDLGGTLICAAIVAYIVHLWIYYGRESKAEE